MDRSMSHWAVCGLEAHKEQALMIRTPLTYEETHDQINLRRTALVLGLYNQRKLKYLAKN